jgi:hypothetical protein
MSFDLFFKRARRRAGNILFVVGIYRVLAFSFILAPVFFYFFTHSRLIVALYLSIVRTFSVDNHFANCQHEISLALFIVYSDLISI